MRNGKSKKQSKLKKGRSKKLKRNLRNKTTVNYVVSEQKNNLGQNSVKNWKKIV